MTARTRGRIALASALVLCGSGLTACAANGPETCVDWPDLETDAERRDAADVVIIGTIGDRDGTERMLGVDAHAWDVTVDETLDGDIEAGETIRVVSTPPTCSESLYPNGDPLDVEQSVVLYLTGDDAAGWATITPYDGVAPAI